MSNKKKPTAAEAPAPVPPQPMQPVQPMQQPVMQQAYDPNAYYQQPVDPNKGKAKLLTLEYFFAMGSAVAATLLSIDLIRAVVGLWVNSTGFAVSSIGGYFAPDMVTPATGIVASGVMAVLLSILSFVLFGRVSRTVPEREGYTETTGYKLITYGGLTLLLMPAITLVAQLISILINSLLFIGVKGAGEAYKSLYLMEFLPYLAGLAIVSIVVFCIYKIVNGQNKSKIMSVVLIAVTSALLLAGAITMAVKAHDSSSRTNNYRSNSSYYIF